MIFVETPHMDTFLTPRTEALGKHSYVRLRRSYIIVGLGDLESVVRVYRRAAHYLEGSHPLERRARGSMRDWYGEYQGSSGDTLNLGRG